MSVYCKWLLCLLWVSSGLGCFVCLFVSLAFYCVFTQKCRNVEKPLVLLCFRSQMLKKHVFCCVFEVLGSENIEFIVILLFVCSTSCIFSENPCAKMQKTQKCWKTIGFIVFSLIDLSKMNVLRVLDAKNLIKPIKKLVFVS